MTEDPHRPDDPYSRVNYRRLIAWEERITREGPFLLSLLDRAPERSVIDLGCGTGEHVAFFAEADARAVGLDRSDSMITAAKDHEVAGKGRFVLGDALEARAALGDESPFGLAICLGNMLPHVMEDTDLARFLTSAHDILRPGGLLLIQILNYEGILATGKRHLPLGVATRYRVTAGTAPGGSDVGNVVTRNAQRVYRTPVAPGETYAQVRAINPCGKLGQPSNLGKVVRADGPTPGISAPWVP